MEGTGRSFLFLVSQRRPLQPVASSPIRTRAARHVERLSAEVVADGSGTRGGMTDHVPTPFTPSSRPAQAA
jgi:hypothetical protein